MERKLIFLLLISVLSTGLGVSSSIGDFSEIDLSGPSSMEIKSNSVFYRNGSFVAEASPATGGSSHLVSFQENGEVNREINLSDRDENLEKAGKVLEGEHIGVLYNESLEVLNLQGEKVDEFQIDRRSRPGFSLYYIEAAYSDGNLYLGETEPCCERGFNFKIRKINQEGVLEWNRTVKAVRDRGGPYAPEITDLSVTGDDELILTGMGEPERNSTEWPENTPEWGNIPQTDFDWKTALISSNGTVKWEAMETSGEGKDRPLKIDTSKQNIQVYGTFPGQNGVFRKATYSKEDGKLLEEASVEFNNSRNSYSGFSQVAEKSDKKYREDYYIFKVAGFDPEKVSKVAVTRSEIHSKASEHIPEEEDISSYSLSEPEIITAEEKSYFMIRPMKKSNWSKTSNLIGEIELDAEFSKPEKLEETVSGKNNSSHSTSEHKKESRGLYSVFHKFLSFLMG